MAAVLKLYLTGGASNADPDASLGGVMSSEELSETPLNNLFDDIDPDQAEVGVTEYRAIGLYNDGDADAVGIEMWFVSDSASPDTSVSVGVDATGTQSIADEEDAPDSPTISFSQPGSGSTLSLDDIEPGEERRIWFKRICGANAVNHNNDEFELAIRYA